MWTILVIRSSICLILWAIRIASSSKVTILCLFDTDITETCQEALSDLPSAQDIGVNVSFRALTLKMGKDLTSAVTDIQASVISDVPDVIFTIGSIYTANAASMFAEFLAIPQVSLTMDSMTYPLYSDTVVRFGPSELDMAEAFFHLIDTQNTSDISVIYQREHAYDEFAFHMRHLALKRPRLKRFKIFGSSKKGCQDQRFLRKIIELRDNGSQLIVLHAGSETTKHILRCAVKYELFQPGHVWISTKGDFRNGSDVTCLPAGFLALEYLPSTGFKTEIRDGLSAIVSTWRLLYLENETTDCNGSGDDLGAAHRFVRSMETSWKKPKVIYNLKNLVREGNSSSWRVVGKVQRNLISVNTIIWPGGFIYGPIAVRKKFLRVVTVPAPPFVHFRDPDNDEHKCYTDTPCLELKKTDRVMDYLDAFVKGGSPEDQQFTFLCCSGLSVDLLNRISQDLDFEFILYFFPDNVNRIGKLVNDTWDGAIGQVYYGTADIMIGALSITAVRSAWIDFTVPFYQSGFTMLSVAQDQQPSIDAFLKPFSTAVWLCILLAATLTAVISSYLEWRSPYGLNPWGRKRNRNYTLGSSLVAVYSVAFGHTFATKSPKSWPSRFILNVWALCSIFMIASYTANLAAFMAGKENVEFYKSPADPRLASKKVAVIGETSVASYIENMYPGLASTLNKTSLKTSIGMITEMKKKHFDIFIHDLPILEYARARLDGDCTLRVVGGTFADDGYGIGLPKHSPWKASMSDLILSYGTSGFLERLENTHFSELVCTSNGIKQRDIQYGLQHTAGLFIMLMVAIGVSTLSPESACQRRQ
ncbi:glutamate receptor ionotropic, NMDA 3A-like [Liolophura sinensis]|uniref:glutamate receptor ionotropic, NMDA 3A-like n=1 Tax=Liolophura sinensis TaxID=3198878 RepID=UPI0031599039